MSCLDDNRLAALLAQALPAEEMARIDAHLHACGRCRELAGELASMQPRGSVMSVASRGSRSGSPFGPGRWLRPGTAVGRYTILGALGAGAMGVVYAAHDPKLDRKVALKLVRLQASRPDRQDAMHARLLAEAQAIARVNHPNVVSVFDAGAYEDRVFLAMELVEGATLGDWLRERPRAPEEVLPLLLAAGRGLAAAHDAGVVHRDFKPENVLLGSRPGPGSVKVADFGLACARPEGDSSPGTPLGGVAGTPAYMAPEQRAGWLADARSDQYSFAVTLHEALFGARPGESGGRKARVPAWLRKIVEIGLRPEPADRYRSLSVLLDAIERGSRRTRQRPWFAIGAAAAVAVAVLGGHSVREARARGALLCTGGEQEVAQAWNGQRRAAMTRAFASTGLPFAEATGARAAALLDQYAGDLAREKRETCAATRIKGTQSEAMLDRRMRCLDGLRAELGMLAERLEHADPKIAGGAVSAASGLPSPATCSAARALSDDGDPASIDPAITQLLGEARTVYRLGQYAEATRLGERVLERARSTNARRVEAETLLLLGSSAWDQRQAERASGLFFDAYEKAEELGVAPVAADAAAHLVWTSAQLDRREENERWIRLGAAAIRRAGGDDELAGQLSSARTIALLKFGRHRDALAEGKRSLELLEKQPSKRIELTRVLRSMSDAHAALGQVDEAWPPIERAVQITEGELGAEHPRLALLLHTAGAVRASQGRYAEALPLLRRAIVLYTRAAEGNPMVAAARGIVGQSLAATGHLAEARDEIDRALVEGKANPAFGKLYLGHLHAQRGAIARLEKRYDFAIEQFRIAERLLAEALPASDPRQANPRVGTARVHLDRGRPRVAVPLLEEALRLLESDGADVFRAEVRFALARALVESKASAKTTDVADRARVLARDAATFYRRSASYARELREVEDWLAQHPSRTIVVHRDASERPAPSRRRG